MGIRTSVPADALEPSMSSDRRFRVRTSLFKRIHVTSLPMFWNIARGDLSLIGPLREPLAVHNSRQQALPSYSSRRAGKPGLLSRSNSYALRPIAVPALGAFEYGPFRLNISVVALTAQRAVSSMVQHVAAFAWLGSRGIAGQKRSFVQTIHEGLRGSRSSAPQERPKSELESALIVGAGSGGRLLVNEMRRNPSWGFRPIGFVDDDCRLRHRRIAGLYVLGDSKEIPEIVTREQVDVVVIAVPSATEITISRIADFAQQSTARVLTMPHLGSLLRGEASASTLQQVDISNVLGRPAVMPDVERCRSFIAGRRVLITGAAGSIGQELTRQVAQLSPKLLVALDTNETGLFDLQAEMSVHRDDFEFRAVVASVINQRRLAAIFERYQPQIVFHAAAYKHVPLMEEHPEEAVTVNALGTYWVAQAAAAAAVERFVLVSTDKAVRPSSVMGATKRVAELAVRAVALETGLSACCVRFGNVLGSRGSVIPTFIRQIDKGGPVTVTHPDMKRYFMTIPEAASLIIEAGAFGDRNTIYMLDMGEEVTILDLAKRMIRLRGLRLGRDIEIVFTGPRPGEKLREELVLTTEVASPTLHPKIRILDQSFVKWQEIAAELRRLHAATANNDAGRLRTALFRVIAVTDGFSAVIGEASATIRHDSLQEADGPQEFTPVLIPETQSINAETSA